MELYKIILGLVFLSATVVIAADEWGNTQIAKWKNDKACAFILMFDDSSTTHVTTVFPELVKRNLTATFYINPERNHYVANKEFWEKTVPEAGFELGNHTLTHKGGDTPDEVKQEILSCNEVIRDLTPTDPWPRLITFAKPGGLKEGRWPLSAEEQSDFLADNLLIIRPGFGGRGAQIAFKTGDEMLAHVDKAVQDGSMECIIFHGVGGDWIFVPTEEFTTLLDGLGERQDQVWVTHHISAYKYRAERDAASINVLSQTDTHLTLELSTSLDPALYNEALSLKTKVPQSWKKVQVVQGDAVTEVDAHQGIVLYDALPGSEPITLTRK
ncbi:polysaccharide deacetylase family protein [Kiritimatiellota bacterium B12222]|nr:polysaccharide deacetylase family protein [Kiritimatiellota bacterium B12222]